MELLLIGYSVLGALTVTSVAIVALYLITVNRKIRGKRRRR